MNKKELAEFQAHSNMITEQYLDGQQYDRLRLINETRLFLAQSAETMLEAGRRLIVMKEHEPHGEFINIIEQQLGMGSAIARRMMQAAAKFMNPKLANNQQVIALGKTKLYELIAEDDDELAELAEGGTVAGLTLDDIDCMSTRELRKALREARDTATAKEELLANKDKKINDLTAAKRRLAKQPPDEIYIEMCKEGSQVTISAEKELRCDVWNALTQIREYGNLNSIPVESWINGQLSQLEDVIAEIRDSLVIYREEYTGQEVENANDHEDEPFFTGMGPAGPTYAESVTDRKAMVNLFSEEECNAALAIDGLQKSVITAIEKRLTELA